MEFVGIAGGQIELRRIPGPRPDAPVIVFLHEALGSVSHWRDFPAELCARTASAGVVYSRFGHGQSSPLATGIPRPMDFCLVEARQVLPALLSTLGIVTASRTASSTRGIRLRYRRPFATGTSNRKCRK